MLTRKLALALGCALLCQASLPARGTEAPAVVATIAPLHSLVTGVMDGVGRPHLLLPGGASPHSYALKPSDARRLAEARVVFWIGETLEAFLERPLAALAGKARVIELLDAPGLVRLPVREGGVWETHEDDHAKDGTENHGHAKDGHEAHKGADAHVWLDPANARAMVAAIAAALAEADPANAGAYAANARAMNVRLDALDTRIAARLASVKERPYIVFHDAYQYFERRYGLRPAGAVTVGSGRAPGARRRVELRARIRDSGAGCVFIEPQFEPRIAQTVVEGTDARIDTLDPLGAALTPGPDAYFALLDGLAEGLARCLAGGRADGQPGDGR